MFLSSPSSKPIQVLIVSSLQNKLQRGEYPTLTSLESDVKRLVSNAKQFNEPSSDIHHDAERIRKATFNFMSKHNPAYKDKNYIAYPTPLPEQPNGALHGDTNNGEVSRSTPAPAPTRTLKLTAAKSVKHAPKEEPPQIEENIEEDFGEQEEEEEEGGNQEEEEGEAVDGTFAGKSFQEAQDQIIKEMMHYKDPELSLIHISEPTRPY